MPEVRFVSLILVCIGLLLAVARVTRLPQSVVLFAGGLLSVLIPGPLPPLSVDPIVVLAMLLTPLLYAGVVGLSPVGLRHVLVRGVLAGVLLTLGLTLVGALVTTWLLPGVSAVAALLLGLTLSVGDTQCARDTGADRVMPRALTDGLDARIVTAPVVTVSLVALAGEHLVGPLPGVLPFAGRLALDVAAGGALGFAVGLAVAEVRRRMGPAPIDVALSLATPFLGAMLAELAGVSVVAVVIAAAVTVAWRMVDRRTGEAISSPEARLVARHFWGQVAAIVAAALFFLMGRALPEALAGAGALPWPRLLLAAGGLVAAGLTLQFALELGLRLLPKARCCPDAEGRPVGALRAALPAAWVGGRSVVALAIALSVPRAAPDGSPFPERDVVVAVTALMVIGAALLQWATLAGVLRWARLGGEAEAAEEVRMAAEVAHAAADTAEPDAGAAAARRTLAALQACDAVGNAARRAGEEAADARARAAQIAQQAH